jgi:metal-sulfur cluster biosynthetic enzyme
MAAPVQASGLYPRLYDDVLQRLDRVHDPCSITHSLPEGLVAMGLISRLALEDHVLRVDMRLTGPGCVMVGYFQDEVRKALRDLPEIDHVDVTFDVGLDWHPRLMSDDALARRDERLRAIRASLATGGGR